MVRCSRIATIYFLSFCLCFAKSEIFDSCETNDNCKKGQFCYEPSKMCAFCIDCRKYNRAKPEWTECPEEPLKCGACLDGYQEEILTKGEKREFCFKRSIRSSTEESNNYSLRTLASSLNPDENETLIFVNENRGGSGTTLIIIGVCAVCVVGLVGVSYVAMRHRYKRRIQANCPHELSEFMRAQDSPPPYCSRDRVQIGPERTETTAEISAPISDCLSFSVEAESLQKANPFRPPDYENAERREEPEPIEPMDAHEEDTMPSFWTPFEYQQQNDSSLKGRSEVDNNSTPDRESDAPCENDTESLEPPARTSAVYNNGVTRVESVNLEGGSASVNNVNANSNSFTFNITHFAFFNGSNDSSRSGNSMNDSNGNVNNGGGAESAALNGGSAICISESSPHYIPFRP